MAKKKSFHHYEKDVLANIKPEYKKWFEHLLKNPYKQKIEWSK